jgi:AMIN domain-containing protein
VPEAIGTPSAGGRPLRRAKAARLLVVLLAALVAWPLGARGQNEPPAELSEVVIVERDAAVEVWVRLSRPAKYQAELIDSPWRLVLDLEDTAYRWTVRPQPVGVDPVRELRGSQYRKGVARLVIELQRKVAHVIEHDREGLRIVLPREASVAVASPPAAARPRVAPAPAPGSSNEPLLYGVVMLEEQRHAYIFDPTTRQVRRYAVGDAVGKAVVETISEWSVVLKTPTGRVELRVDQAKPEPAQQRR